MDLTAKPELPSRVDTPKIAYPIWSRRLERCGSRAFPLWFWKQAVKGAVGAMVLAIVFFSARFSAAQSSKPQAETSSRQTQNSQQSIQKQTQPASPSSVPNAPAPAQAPQEPSLQDLGFGRQQLQSNPALQARLNRRTEMLKIHQRLGLITVAPMVAALITGPMAKAKGRNGQVIQEPTSANLDMHAALGSATAALYFASAYYAMFAPSIPGEKKRGAIRMHVALASVHLPGMILTPILGAMAFHQEQNGEKVHGIASAHGAVATITAIAYGTSIVAVAWPIHLKFWEQK